MSGRFRDGVVTGGKLDQQRVTMNMVRVEGEWLVDTVDLNNLQVGE